MAEKDDNEVNIEKKEEKEEKEESTSKDVIEEVESYEEKIDRTKKKIGTFGNILLILFIIGIIITGLMVYYLAHRENKNLQEQYNTIIENSNTVAEIENKINNTNTTTDEEPGSIANMIDSMVPTTNTTTTNTIKANEVKTLNEQLIVLYDGLILNTSEMKVVKLNYIDKSSLDKDKYVITYYNYENFAYVDSKLGTLSDEIYSGAIGVKNVGKIALSEKYEAIPREIKVVNAVPDIVAQNNDLSKYDSVKAIISDLDGNGTTEYVLILANRKTGYSKITLVDSQGSKVADLAYIEKSKWESATTEEYHLSISNIEIIDIDNDDTMEIVLELPTYEGAPDISLVKYKNGELQGQVNYECSLLP
ncbi:MAG: hypothetical protein IKN74_02355 [Clostridia bacterium]|nr:hypothetical protein [Clostridia bacterium]